MALVKVNDWGSVTDFYGLCIFYSSINVRRGAKIGRQVIERVIDSDHWASDVKNMTDHATYLFDSKNRFDRVVFRKSQT